MKLIQKIWWWSLAVKLGLAVVLPFSQDEAYYWVWSKHPQFGYEDHPAMVSWLMWVGNFFESFGQAPRWPSVFLGHLTLLIWILILQRILPDFDVTEREQREKTWMWLVLSSPMIGVGSILALPDVPVIFFWSLATLFLCRIVEKQRLVDYIGLGLSLGLGFCSKYHIVIFVIAALIWFFVKRQWKQFSFLKILCTIISGFTASLPVLWWNYKNDYQSFRYQLDHGLGSSSWDFFWTWSFVIGQALLIGPMTIWLAVKAKLSEKYQFIVFTAWTPFVFFLFSSFRGLVEANWPSVAFPAMYALAVARVGHLKLLRWTFWPWSVVTIIVVFQQIVPSWKDFLPERIYETHYFEPVLPLKKTYSPLYYGSFQMASRVWWEYKSPAFKLYKIRRHDFYDDLQGGPPQEERFYVVRENWIDLPDWITQEAFQIKKIKDLSPEFRLDEITRKSL